MIRQIQKILYYGLVYLICCIIISFMLIGMLIWKVFKSEYVLMSLDRFIEWLDKVLKVNEVRE